MNLRCSPRDPGRIPGVQYVAVAAMVHTPRERLRPRSQLNIRATPYNRSDSETAKLAACLSQQAVVFIPEFRKCAAPWEALLHAKEAPDMSQAGSYKLPASMKGFKQEDSGMW